MEEKKITISESAKNVIACDILIEPWITEASTAMGESNKYVFKVFPKANKKQIKDSVEKIYEVKVMSVNTTTLPRKARHQGRTSGWKAAFKKAVVTLKAGDSIDLFGKK